MLNFEEFFATFGVNYTLDQSFLTAPKHCFGGKGEGSENSNVGQRHENGYEACLKDHSSFSGPTNFVQDCNSNNIITIFV